MDPHPSAPSLPLSFTLDAGADAWLGAAAAGLDTRVTVASRPNATVVASLPTSATTAYATIGAAPGVTPSSVELHTALRTTGDLNPSLGTGPSSIDLHATLGERPSFADSLRLPHGTSIRSDLVVGGAPYIAGLRPPPRRDCHCSTASQFPSGLPRPCCSYMDRGRRFLVGFLNVDYDYRHHPRSLLPPRTERVATLTLGARVCHGRSSNHQMATAQRLILGHSPVIHEAPPLTPEAPLASGLDDDHIAALHAQAARLHKIRTIVSIVLDPASSHSPLPLLTGSGPHAPAVCSHQPRPRRPRYPAVSILVPDG
jgi:hypothetical protein